MDLAINRKEMKVEGSLTRSAAGWTVAVALLLTTAGAGTLRGQSANSAGMISIRLEQKVGEVTKPVLQNTVFRNGNVLRFQITSHVSGYLYVVDRGTTGETNTLFPGANAIPGDNHIEDGKTYAVPANGDGWFEVTGPPGFDILYFLVSATPIALPSAPAAEGQNSGATEKTEPLPPGMLPRCDDAIFKARGECIDASAGVAPLAAGASVPRELVPLAQTASRDIILTDDGDDTAVKPAAASKLPLIYTFRLAHRE
jgi:hypothetical protein